jgi:SMODS-associating 4TM effector domain
VSNTIPADQNKPEGIRCLRASRQVLKEAKDIGTLQQVLSATSAVAGPAVSVFFPYLRAWPALYGAIILLVDVIFLEPELKRKQELKAKIQELFDTELYDLDWNLLKCGKKPDAEDLVALAANHQKKNPSRDNLLNWYPADVGKLPIDHARFVCQRANMRWDSSLRRKFSRFYIIGLVAMWAVGAIYGLGAGMTMAEFVLSVVVPILPLSVKLWRDHRKQVDAAEKSERTKEYLEEVWHRSFMVDFPPSPLSLKNYARDLQDELYQRRKTAPDIPDWFYSRSREDFERQMKQGSAEMVSEAGRNLGLDFEAMLSVDQLMTLAQLVKEQVQCKDQAYFAWRDAPVIDSEGLIVGKVSDDAPESTAGISTQRALDIYKAKLDGAYSERFVLSVCTAIAAAERGREVALLQFAKEPNVPFDATGWLVLTVDGHPLFHLSPTDLPTAKANEAGLVTVVPQDSPLAAKFDHKGMNKVEEFRMLLDMMF